MYFNEKTPPQLSIRECQKAEMYFKLVNNLYRKHLPNNRKSSLSYNFVLQKILLVLSKIDYSRLIPNAGCESTYVNKTWDRITRDPE